MGWDLSLGSGQGGVREIRGHLQGLWKYVGQKIDQFLFVPARTMEVL